MRYAYVQNGIILDGPRGLPKSWGNSSGFDLLSEDELIPLGWLPYYFIESNAPGDQWVLTDSKIEVKTDRVIETQQYRLKTQKEIDEDIASQEFQKKQSRAEAYRKESDPLFFKSERGESTREEWLAKVQEIKLRYP